MLLSRGVTKGDRVCLFMDNSADFCVAFFGILRVCCMIFVGNIMNYLAASRESRCRDYLRQIGALFVPLRPLLTRDDLAFMLKDTEPTVLLVDQGAFHRPSSHCPCDDLDEPLSHACSSDEARIGVHS